MTLMRWQRRALLSLFVRFSAVASMRSAIGFVDPTVHYRRPYWKRKDWDNSDGFHLRCPDNALLLQDSGLMNTPDGQRGVLRLDLSRYESLVREECAWEIAGDYSETKYDLRRELWRRHERLPTWSEFMAERSQFVQGDTICNHAEIYFHVGNFLRAMHSWGVVALQTFINIGSNDGVFQGDPLQFLYSDETSWAIAVERDPALCEAHRHNFPNVTMLCEAIRPDLLEQRFLPELRRIGLGDSMSVDVLKVDIDSYDCDLVIGLFGLGLRPKFIVMEVNVNVPPPFKFNWNYHHSTWDIPLHNSDNDWNWMFPVFGCSLSAQAAAFKPYGYSLVHFWESDAIFAHESQLEALFSRGAITGALNEYDCYQKALLSTNGVDLRTMRRWLHEISVKSAFLEVSFFLRHVYLHYIQKHLPKNISDLPYDLSL